MRKQLTMIKAAGVAVSLAAAGIAGMASANTRCSAALILVFEEFHYKENK